MNVELGEEGLALEAVDDVTNEGEGVVVANSPLVQGSVVHDGTELTTLLLAVEQSGCIR